MQYLCLVRRPPARTTQRSVVRLGWCLIAALAAACSDGAPPTAPKLTPPDSALMNIPTVQQWSVCSGWYSSGGTTWSCEYSHSTSYDVNNYDYWVGEVWYTTKRDCQRDSAAYYCDNNFRHPGGGSSYPSPNPPPNVVADDAQDDVQNPQGKNLKIPVCPLASSDTSVHRKAYCAGTAPKADSPEYGLIKGALARMKLKGGICATLAAIGEGLLARGTLHVFPHSTYRFGGYSPVGGATPANGGPSQSPYAWTVISNRYTKDFPDAASAAPANGHPVYRSYPYTLQSALAHELDHLNGQFHVPYSDAAASTYRDPRYTADPWTTANTRRCDDVDDGF
jgi:hypothetical protein